MSDVTIVNNALGKLGDDPITSLSDQTERAKLANRIYTDVRDATLRAHSWNFALRRAALTTTGNTPAFEFTYEYNLPADCLRVLKIDNLTGKWKIENGKLLSDLAAVKILYVSRVTDTTQYDTLFTEAFAARLASEMAIPITANIDTAKEMWNLYKNKVEEAKLIDEDEESQYTADIPLSAVMPENFENADFSGISHPVTEESIKRVQIPHRGFENADFGAVAQPVIDESTKRVQMPYSGFENVNMQEK